MGAPVFARASEMRVLVMARLLAAMATALTSADKHWDVLSEVVPEVGFQDAPPATFVQSSASEASSSSATVSLIEALPIEAPRATSEATHVEKDVGEMGGNGGKGGKVPPAKLTEL